MYFPAHNTTDFTLLLVHLTILTTMLYFKHFELCLRNCSVRVRQGPFHCDYLSHQFSLQSDSLQCETTKFWEQHVQMMQKHLMHALSMGDIGYPLLYDGGVCCKR